MSQKIAVGDKTYDNQELVDGCRPTYTFSLSTWLCKDVLNRDNYENIKSSVFR